MEWENRQREDFRGHVDGEGKRRWFGKAGMGGNQESGVSPIFRGSWWLTGIMVVPCEIGQVLFLILVVRNKNCNEASHIKYSI